MDQKIIALVSPVENECKVYCVSEEGMQQLPNLSTEMLTNGVLAYANQFGIEKIEIHGDLIYARVLSDSVVEAQYAQYNTNKITVEAIGE